MTGREVLDMMGRGYLLLANDTEAILVDAGWSATGLLPDVYIPHAAALEAIRGTRGGRFRAYAIAPLCQFRWYPRSGWRELVGSRGEKFDVFAMTQ